MIIKLVDELTDMFKTIDESILKFNKLKKDLDNGLKLEDFDSEMTELEEEMIGYLKSIQQLEEQINNM